MAQDNAAKFVQKLTGLKFTDTDGDNTAQVLKASGGTLLRFHIQNPNAAIEYVQFFDVAAGSVTVGTTVPDFFVGVPVSGYATYELDLPFGTAITYACTTTPTGNTNPGTGLVISATYI